MRRIFPVLIRSVDLAALLAEMTSEQQAVRPCPGLAPMTILRLCGGSIVCFRPIAISIT